MERKVEVNGVLHPDAFCKFMQYAGLSDCINILSRQTLLKNSLDFVISVMIEKEGVYRNIKANKQDKELFIIRYFMGK